jgi:hypothetical protein
MDHQFKITGAMLMRERKDVIDNLIGNYIFECRDNKDVIYSYCNNENANIHNSDEDIWNIIRMSGECHISAMFLQYPKIGDFNKALKKLIYECRKEFRNQLS